MFSVNDDAFVVKFGYLLITAHDNGRGVVSQRVVPFFIEAVDDGLNVFIQIGSVDDQPQSDATLCSILKRRKERVLSPAIGPIHVEVLKR